MNPFLHEADISNFVFKNLKKGDNFIDVGAMGGLYSIIASKLVGNKGKVIAIEPHYENKKVLEMNINLNDLKNVSIKNKAIGDKLGDITIFYNKSSLDLASAFPGRRKYKFKTEQTTLDSLIDIQSNIKIIKIDTEGYDEKVLLGAERILQKTKYVVVETNNNSIQKLLSEKGFICKKFHPSNYLLGINPFIK
jgi:FkbM family methyltransferase